MNATMMFVMLMLTVPTLMVHIIASAEGYIRDGQSCQCRLEQRYLMSSKTPFHNQNCLHNWANDQEATQWFSRPDLAFLLSYGYHNMHRYTIF